MLWPPTTLHTCLAWPFLLLLLLVITWLLLLFVVWHFKISSILSLKMASTLGSTAQTATPKRLMDRDSLGLAPISTLPNGLLQLHGHTFAYPGQPGLLTIPYGLQQQLGHRSPYSRGGPGFWHIEAPPNGLPLQPNSKSPLYYGDSPGLWPIQAPSNGLHEQPRLSTIFQQQQQVVESKLASKEGAIGGKRIGREHAMWAAPVG